MTVEFIISLLLTGLIVGALGRLALPGPQPIGILMTILLGVAGAFLGGLASAALGVTGWASFLLAVLAAALLIWVVGGGAARRRRVW